MDIKSQFTPILEETLNLFFRTHFLGFSSASFSVKKQYKKRLLLVDFITPPHSPILKKINSLNFIFSLNVMYCTLSFKKKLYTKCADLLIVNPFPPKWTVGSLFLPFYFSKHDDAISPHILDRLPDIVLPKVKVLTVL